ALLRRVEDVLAVHAGACLPGLVAGLLPWHGRVIPFVIIVDKSYFRMLIRTHEPGLDPIFPEGDADGVRDLLPDAHPPVGRRALAVHARARDLGALRRRRLQVRLVARAPLPAALLAPAGP